MRVTTSKASPLKADRAKNEAINGKGPIPCVNRAMLGPATAATTPPATTQEIARLLKSPLATSAAAKR
jgi:hypothetical protein